MPNRQKFAILRAARRVWAIGSIHGEAERLERLQRALWSRLEPGDRIVYLGNMIGRGPAVGATIDALLRFRGEALARPRGFACDIAYLRGSQEEMWQKLQQLQFATAPRDVLGWMVDQGVGATLAAYGASVEDAQRAAQGGVVGLTRWNSALRSAMQARPGHTQLVTALRRAAFTDDGQLLFVNAGLDPSRPLETQNDSFWWHASAFARITDPYGGFRRVVRGFDPRHPGIELGDFTATVDGGCGFGGPLLAGCFALDGSLADSLEA
jgi:serine/threonine protein phosphatase 1